MAPQLVWLITGTSSGLGRQLSLSALKRGDKVIATARGGSIGRLEDLKRAGADILELDVTAPLDQLKAAAKKAVAIHGRIDVLVNNAGYIETGTLEETTPEETLNQFNTNVFGPLNVNRAFLPYMRERKTGTIVWLGSIAAYGALPGAGLYNATKFAVRGLAETFSEEVKTLGLRSICFEFGYFRTDFLAPGHRSHEKERIDDYKPIHEHINSLASRNHQQPGDPQKGVEVMLDVVRGEGFWKDKPTPALLGLGSDTYEHVKKILSAQLQRQEEYKEVMFSTDIVE